MISLFVRRNFQATMQYL